MTSFGWKRKLNKLTSIEETTFGINDEKEKETSSAITSSNWEKSLRIKRARLEESCAQKAKNLRERGSALATEGKYKEALKVWDEAQELVPTDAVVHEMRAQVLMQLGENFAAVVAAECAVKYDDKWWIAYQTLGRAQLCIGEAEMALKNFCQAYHLNPTDEELRTVDIEETRRLLKAKEQAEKRGSSGAEMVSTDSLVFSEELKTQNENTEDKSEEGDKFVTFRC